MNNELAFANNVLIFPVMFMQTIVLIPVCPHGVLQLGALETVCFPLSWHVFPYALSFVSPFIMQWRRKDAIAIMFHHGFDGGYVALTRTWTWIRMYIPTHTFQKIRGHYKLGDMFN